MDNDTSIHHERLKILKFINEYLRQINTVSIGNPSSEKKTTVYDKYISNLAKSSTITCARYNQLAKFMPSQQPIQHLSQGTTGFKFSMKFLKPNTIVMLDPSQRNLRTDNLSLAYYLFLVLHPHLSPIPIFHCFPIMDGKGCIFYIHQTKFDICQFLSSSTFHFSSV